MTQMSSDLDSLYPLLKRLLDRADKAGRNPTLVDGVFQSPVVYVREDEAQMLARVVDYIGQGVIRTFSPESMSQPSQELATQADATISSAPTQSDITPTSAIGVLRDQLLTIFPTTKAERTTDSVVAKISPLLPGASRNAVAVALVNLTNEGLLTRVRRGVYRRAPVAGRSGA